MERENLIGKIIFVIGVILLIIGIVKTLTSFKEVEVKEEKEEEVMEEKEEETNEVIEEEEEESDESLDYLMTLEIPKINLNRDVYKLGSYKNNVNLNIEILKESDMPDKEKGNVILASHSGSSSVAYFNDLDKLEIGDKVNLYYLDNIYTYEIVSFYEVEKTGNITIHRDQNESVIVLITCKKYNDNTQVVYIGNLIEVTK